MSYNSNIYANTISQGLSTSSVLSPSQYTGYISQALLNLDGVQGDSLSVNNADFSVVYNKFFNKTGDRATSRIMAVAFLYASSDIGIDPLWFIDNFIAENSTLYKDVVEYTNKYRNADGKHEITTAINNNVSPRSRDVLANVDTGNDTEIIYVPPVDGGTIGGGTIGGGTIGGGTIGGGTNPSSLVVSSHVISSTDAVITSGSLITSVVSSTTLFNEVRLTDKFNKIQVYTNLSPTLVGDEFVVSLPYVLSTSYLDKSGDVYLDANIINGNSSSSALRSNILQHLSFSIELGAPEITYASEQAICGSNTATVDIPFTSPEEFDSLDPDITVTVSSDAVITDDIFVDFDNNKISITVSAVNNEYDNSWANNTTVNVSSSFTTQSKTVAFFIRVTDKEPLISNNTVDEYQIDGEYAIETVFDQPVKILSISNESGFGTLTSTIIDGYVEDNTSILQLSIDDNPTSEPVNITYQAQSMCGRVTTLVKQYTVKEPNIISVTLIAPQSEVILPFDVSKGNYNIVGTINTDPILELDMNVVDNVLRLDTAKDIVLDVRNDGTYLIINEFVLRDFYYVSGVSITVSFIAVG